MIAREKIYVVPKILNLILLINMKNFIRVRENFECERCGRKVEGDGYTDHCPVCLWGKHVDKEIPGDRLSDCGGLMEPIGVRYQAGKFDIYYRCVKCKHEFWVREGRGDNREILVNLVNFVVK